MPARKTRSAASLTSEHDPGVAAARARVEGISVPTPAFTQIGSTGIRFGTASWTDPTLLAPGVFYPERVTTPEARLKHYARLFSVVEVDSSYYALPAPRMAELWVERTPESFVFDIKAFGWMTGHPTETERLPRALKEALPPGLAAKKRLYAKEVPREVREEAWRLFVEAMRPLREAGKLGAIFLQYPSWVRPAEHSAEMLERTRRRLGDLPIAVEFRHGDWLASAQRERTFHILRDNEMSYVIVDEPQGFPSSVPPVTAVPSPHLAVVRLHGHRNETWEKRGVPVVERFRYLYSEQELEPWVPKIEELAGESEQVHVVFNNCYGNYGTTNALEMAGLILRSANGER